jgi:hypothetical protein
VKNKISIPLRLGTYTALLYLILGAVVIVFPPNYYGFTSLAAILLGFGYLIPSILSPLVSLLILGAIGFIFGLISEFLWNWKHWARGILVLGIPLLLILNTLSFIIWSYGNVEGHW